MSNNNEPEITLLTPSHNFAVVKLRDRKFPGIHFQGDSTSIILSDLQSIKKYLEEGDLEEVNDIADDLIERFDDILNFYEKVAKENGFNLPYSNRANSKA